MFLLVPFLLFLRFPIFFPFPFDFDFVLEWKGEGKSGNYKAEGEKVRITKKKKKNLLQLDIIRTVQIARIAVIFTVFFSF